MIHKAIKGFEDYLITDTGRVYSIKSQKYMKQRQNNRGYLMVSLCKNAKHTNLLVHRLVAKAFLKNVYNKPQVDHIDRNQDNNHVANLRWVDNTENFLNRDHSKVREAGLKGAKVSKRKNSKPLVWKINDEVSFGYCSYKDVKKPSTATICEHVNKNECSFKSCGKEFLFVK